jgi:hypothetical protein
MHLSKENRWMGERGMGERGGFSIQPTWVQSGREIAPRHKGGFQASKGGVFEQQKGVSKRG